MKVRIFGQLDFYAPTGRLGLKMAGIDPRFTLGELSQARDQVVRRLVAAGLFDANRARPLSPIPLRVGVVASVGSAAWHDFRDELDRSGYGFHLAVCDARVQGEWAESMVAAAIRTLSRRGRPRLRRRDPWRRRPQRAGDVRRRVDRAGDRHQPDPRAHRSRPRDRPQRRRRGRPHRAQDADRLCRRVDRRRPRLPGRDRAVLGGDRSTGTAGSRRASRPRCPTAPTASPAARTPPSNAPTSDSPLGSTACARRRRARLDEAVNGMRGGRRRASVVAHRSSSSPSSATSTRSPPAWPCSIPPTCCGAGGASRAPPTATSCAPSIELATGDTILSRFADGEIASTVTPPPNREDPPR